MSDAAHSMETVRVDPRTLEMLRGNGQSRSSAQPTSGQSPAAGSGAGSAAYGAPAAGGRTLGASERDLAARSLEGSAATVALPSGGFRPPAGSPAPGSQPTPSGGPRPASQGGAQQAAPGGAAGYGAYGGYGGYGAGAAGSAYGQPTPAAGPAAPGQSAPANPSDAVAATVQAPFPSAAPGMSGSAPTGSSQAAPSATPPMGSPQSGRFSAPQSGGLGGQQSSDVGTAPGGAFAAPGSSVASDEAVPMSAASGPGPVSAPSGSAPAAGSTSAPSGSAPAAGSAAFGSPYSGYSATGQAPAQPGASAMSVPLASGSAPVGAGASASGPAYSAPPTGNLNDYFTGAAAPAPDAQSAGLSAAPSDSAFAEELEDDVPPPGGSFGKWMLTLLLAGLPLIGIVYLCVLSFGGSAPAWRRNWARAMLAWVLIVAVLSGILFAVAGSALFQMLGG